MNWTYNGASVDDLPEGTVVRMDQKSEDSEAEQA